MINFDSTNAGIYINKMGVTLSLYFNDKYGISGISIKGKVTDFTVNNIVKVLRQKKLQYSVKYPIYAAVSGLILMILYFMLINISH